MYRGRDRKHWRVRIWWRGVRRDHVVEGAHADAEQWEATERVRLSGLEPADPRQPQTFGDFYRTRYAPHAATHLAPQTLSQRGSQWALLLRHFETARVDRIGQAQWDPFVAVRQAAGVGPTTINDNRKVLLAVLSHAGLKPRIAKLRERGRAGRVKFWTAAQVRALLAACRRESPEILPLVLFLANTGARKTEGIRLRWEGLEFARARAWIEPSEDWQPKDGEPREVPLSRSLAAVLRRQPKRGPFVFTTGREPHGPFAYWPQLRFDRARKAAGLTGGPHTLRHSFATLFLARRPDLPLLSAILGQSQQRTTLLYAHLLPGRVERASGVVDFAAGPRDRTPDRTPEGARKPRRRKPKAPDPH